MHNFTRGLRKCTAELIATVSGHSAASPAYAGEVSRIVFEQGWVDWPASLCGWLSVRLRDLCDATRWLHSLVALLQGPGVRVRSPSPVPSPPQPHPAQTFKPTQSILKSSFCQSYLRRQTFPRPVLAGSQARLDPREAAQGPTCAHAGFWNHSLQSVSLCTRTGAPQPLRCHYSRSLPSRCPGNRLLLPSPSQPVQFTWCLPTNGQPRHSGPLSGSGVSPPPRDWKDRQGPSGAGVVGGWGLLLAPVREQIYLTVSRESN